MRFSRVWTMAALLMTAAFSGPAAQAQSAAALPHAAGTVKSTSATGLTLTTPGGQDVTVTVPAGAKVLVVPPGSTTLKSATDGTLNDVAAGDRALVTGQEGDTATSLTASRVILMKANAIAQVHAAEDAAWTQGGGGIVKSVDPATGHIVVANGLKTFTVDARPATIIRRYSGASIRFADAKPGTIEQIHPGDQLRVRGAKSPDGSTIQADELVTGTFHNYSGLIASVDSAAGTVTLKDLATKKTVTVAVTPNSDLRRLPPFVAQRVAAQMRGGAAKTGGSEARPETGERGGAASGGEGSAGRAGMDLSQMLARLPTETLSNIKVGDAAMIVATAPSSDSEKSTAVTLLVGVDAILTAPSGQSATLTPWSVGSGEPTDAGGGGGEGGGGGPH